MSSISHLAGPMLMTTQCLLGEKALFWASCELSAFMRPLHDKACRNNARPKCRLSTLTNAFLP